MRDPHKEGGLPRRGREPGCLRARCPPQPQLGMRPERVLEYRVNGAILTLTRATYPEADGPSAKRRMHRKRPPAPLRPAAARLRSVRPPPRPRDSVRRLASAK